jgi:hypothetical protein
MLAWASCPARRTVKERSKAGAHASPARVCQPARSVRGARDARSLVVAVVRLDPAGAAAPFLTVPAWGGANGSGTSTHRPRSSRPGARSLITRTCHPSVHAHGARHPPASIAAPGRYPRGREREVLFSARFCGALSALDSPRPRPPPSQTRLPSSTGGARCRPTWTLAPPCRKKNPR